MIKALDEPNNKVGTGLKIMNKKIWDLYAPIYEKGRGC